MLLLPSPPSGWRPIYTTEGNTPAEVNAILSRSGAVLQETKLSDGTLRERWNLDGSLGTWTVICTTRIYPGVPADFIGAELQFKSALFPDYVHTVHSAEQ